LGKLVFTKTCPITKTQRLLLDVGQEAVLEIDHCHMLVFSPEYRETVSRYFENVAILKHLGMTLIIQDCIHEEIKIRYNSGHACSYPDPNM
jgi:hypothetical protein